MNATTATSENAARLKERLRAQLRMLRFRLAGHAALMFLGGAGLILGAAVLASPAWMPLGPWGSYLVRGALLLAGLWVLVFEAILPLRRVANLKGFSRELERHGDYNNMLEAATQFTSRRKDDPLQFGASPGLVSEILRRARVEAERTTLAPRIPLVGASFHASVALGALALWLVLGLVAPDRVRDSLAALGTPELLSTAPPDQGVYVTSGDLEVPVGSAAELTARDLIGGEEPVVLEINRSGDFWQELPTQLAPPTQHPAPYLDHLAALPEVEDPFRYRFRKGAVVTDEFRVSVLERPVLKALGASLEPPAYTGREASELEDLGGTISVLEGTRVALRGMASTPLAEATRRVDGEAPVQLPVDGASFADEFVIGEDVSFRIGLTDETGLSNDAITVYRFVARPDDPPTVELSQPGEDLTLDRDLEAPLGGLAADDVGLARLDLLFRNSEETEWSRQNLYTRGGAPVEEPTVRDLIVDEGENEVAVGLIWDLSDLDLFPGDTVLYCLEATDNNELVGGQSSRSAVYRLRLPTIAEVFDLERVERDEQGQEMANLLNEGEELQETLERLDRELKKNPNPDWAKQQEIRDAMERQQALREKLQETSDELQRNLDNFGRNNSGSLELMEKMETIQELMESLQDESLSAYMEAMDEAMDQIQPHELQRAMEEALESQEDQNRRLDRTIELLQQLERERTMSDLVEEVAEYLDRQEELREETARDPESEAGSAEDGEESDSETGDEAGEGDSESEDGESQDDASASSENESGENDSESGDESNEGESPDGENAEGEPNDGENQEGESSEGEPQDGEQSEGEQSEGDQTQSDGEQSDGEQQPPMSDQELADAQERLAEEARELEERIREALEELKKQRQEGGASDPSAEEMKKALEEALEQMSEGGKASKPMKAAQEKLNEGDRNQAEMDQEEASRRLIHLYEVLAEGQQSMQQATGQHAAEKLQATAYDLLNLSFSEEKIVAALEGSTRGQRLAPVTREQGRIQRNTQRISDELQDLASKNFMIPEALLDSMRNLVEMLDRSVEELAMSRSRRSRSTATTTMGEMNRIVMQLLTMAMNAGGQGGGGGSSQGSPSEQMGQLSQDQSRLNAMTEELRGKMKGGGLSDEERRQLAQLKARQQAIQQQLQELRGSLDDERRVLGDLGELQNEIEDVVEELEGGRLSAETERRQEKILSRMLDAQRSIREREFAKRREAREGDTLFTPQEGAPFAFGETERQQQLRRWLAPEKAPHAYQDDVRRYFRQIQGRLDQGTENE